MEQAEIIEGNRLIAEFMGFYITEFNGSYHFVCKERKKPEHLNQAWEFRLEEAKYHSSWDWLMPVVEKIGQSVNVMIQVKICRFSRRFMEAKKFMKENGLNSFEDVDPITEHNESTFIGNIWLCCVDFIKWYISQPSNQ